MSRRTALFVVFVASGVACNAGEADGDGSAAVTYRADVQPILAMRCLGCHTEGGVAPFPLDSYERVREASSVVAFSLSSGRMPPVQTDPECRSYANERQMSEQERSTVLDWIAADMPEGDRNIPPDEPVMDELEEPTRVLVPPEAYTPVEGGDDYRCLVLDGDFDEPTFVTAHQFVPDAAALVHHVILYLVPAASVDALLEAEAQAPGPGYPCFGGSGHGGQPMGVWAPGGGAQRFPEGSAFVVPQGAKIVAQMHYNTAVGAAVADRSALRMVTTTPPQSRVTMPLYNGFFEIPAGDGDARLEFSLDVPEGPVRHIVSVMPHMHLLGKSIELQHVRGDERTCVSRIDSWSFEWQEFYDLRPDELIEVRPGDRLEYSCTFDNSAGDEPVAFGEGTEDEMCLHVVAMVEPYVEDTGAGLCPKFDACYAECSGAGDSCMLDCIAATGTVECASCMLEGLGACGQAHCPGESTALVQCINASCGVDLADIDGLFACLGTGACAEAFDAQWACLEPALEAGECSDVFGACGATL